MLACGTLYIMEFLDFVLIMILTWIFYIISAWLGREKLHCWWTLFANLLPCENLPRYSINLTFHILVPHHDILFYIWIQIVDPGGIANWSVTHVDWSERKWHPKLYRSQDVTYDLLRNITVGLSSYLRVSFRIGTAIGVFSESLVYHWHSSLKFFVDTAEWKWLEFTSIHQIPNPSSQIANHFSNYSLASPLYDNVTRYDWSSQLGLDHLLAFM